MPLDFVAEVRCFFGRFFARPNANCKIRSTPLREKHDCWKPTSRSVPSYFLFNDTATTEIFSLPLHDALPIYRDRDAVGLRRRGQVFFRALLREVERELQDPVHALAREARLLEDDLAVGALVHAPAHARVLPLGVLTHDEEVDVAGLAVDERRAHAGHEPARAQVHVLIEVAAELDERAPERDVIGHLGGPADSAEEDRVVPADLLLPVLRHHRAVREVVVARPVEVIELQLDLELPRGRVEDAQPLGHDLLADAVAGDHRDPVLCQLTLPGASRPASSRRPDRRSGTSGTRAGRPDSSIRRFPSWRNARPPCAPPTRAAWGSARARRSRSDTTRRSRGCAARPGPRSPRSRRPARRGRRRSASRRGRGCRRRARPRSSSGGRRGRPARRRGRSRAGTRTSAIPRGPWHPPYRGRDRPGSGRRRAAPAASARRWAPSAGAA